MKQDRSFSGGIGGGGGIFSFLFSSACAHAHVRHEDATSRLFLKKKLNASIQSVHRFPRRRVIRVRSIESRVAVSLGTPITNHILIYSYSIDTVSFVERA